MGRLTERGQGFGQEGRGSRVLSCAGRWVAETGFLPTSIDPATEVGKLSVPPATSSPQVKQSYSFLLGDCQRFWMEVIKDPRRKEQQTFRNRVAVNCRVSGRWILSRISSMIENLLRKCQLQQKKCFSTAGCNVVFCGLNFPVVTSIKHIPSMEKIE